MLNESGSMFDPTITWTAASTFTVTLNASADALQVGDEVEGLTGANAGLLAHITATSGAHGALQTVTIDESVTTTTGDSVGTFQRWKKLGTITSTSVYEQFMNTGIDSSFIQFKVELRGPNRELEIAEL